MSAVMKESSDYVCLLECEDAAIYMQIELTWTILSCSVITHADGSRVSIAIMRLCNSVCLSVCPHDKTKTAETKIAKLGTEIVHHHTSPTNEY